MAHEWYGNIITMIDMAERWVQEGFAALGEELMMEYHFEKAISREFFIIRRAGWIKNEYALISRYGIFEDAGPNMYFKGWALQHINRNLTSSGKSNKLMELRCRRGWLLQEAKQMIVRNLQLTSIKIFNKLIIAPGNLSQIFLSLNFADLILALYIILNMDLTSKP